MLIKQNKSLPSYNGFHFHFQQRIHWNYLLTSLQYTGCFLMIKIKYELITPFKMSLYKFKLDANFTEVVPFKYL